MISRIRNYFRNRKLQPTHFINCGTYRNEVVGHILLYQSKSGRRKYEFILSDYYKSEAKANDGIMSSLELWKKTGKLPKGATDFIVDKLAK